MITGDFNVGTPIIGIYTLFFIICSVPGLLFYVLSSIGLMGMLKSCGYSKPYFAWIPIANIYAIGKLAELYDDKKPAANHGKRLIIIRIAAAALSIVIFTLAMMFAFVGSGMGYMSVYALILIIPLYLAVGVLSVIYLVFYYIALWRVYMLFSPSDAVVFLVLSIISGIARSIIFFCLRNSKPVNLRTDFDIPPYGQSKEIDNNTLT